MIKKYIYSLLVFAVLLIYMGCEKQNNWLDVKPTKGSVVPETLADFQAMLDNDYPINRSYSTSGLMGSDNFMLNDVNFNSDSEIARNLYSWNDVIWDANTSSDWNNYYKMIEIANVILEGIAKIDKVGDDYKEVKGQAFFLRAMAYSELLQLFCEAYGATADQDFGLPMRRTSDVNVIETRQTLRESYIQTVNDAKEAVTLLPLNQPYLFRSTRAAAYALLARLSLQMGDYIEAESNANRCLELHPDLIDFNDRSIVSTSLEYRFPADGRNNKEILFYAQSNQYSSISSASNGTGLITEDLYSSYESSDLRKSLFFSNINPKFAGGYTGSPALFCGLATNEVYLIRAECRARLGNREAALKDLNTLLKMRYVTGTYTDKLVSNSQEAVVMVLAERRKELPFTGNIRWADLKRLNRELNFQKKLTRKINGVEHTLLPNDKRYVLPIPTDELLLSGISQNSR